MGNNQLNIRSSTGVSEECKREYFKNAKKDFSAGIKKINSTIHSPGANVSFSEDNWISYLLQKFGDYLKTNKVENKYLYQIMSYLNNLEESNEMKHIYNLTVFLSKEIEGISNEKRRQSLIDKYYSEEEYKNVGLSKDEMLFKGSEFIFIDLENFNHPLYGFIRHLTFVLAEVYEKDYEKIIDSLDKNSNLMKSSMDIMDNFQESPVKLSPANIDKKYCLSENLIPSFKKNDPINNLQINLNSDINHIDNFYKAMIRELFTFSNYIANALIRFYSIKSSTSVKLFEIFCEKIKDLMIRRDLYNLVYKIKSKLNLNKKVKYSENLVNYYNIKPHYLCISPFFSQDKTFRTYIKHQCRKHKTHFESKLVNNDKKTKELTSIPFSKSVVLLRQINDHSSIIKKIDVMYQVRNSILNEIDEFWKDVPLHQKYKLVDADNLLSLFIYITIKSQIENFIIDLEIIEDFTNRSLKLSRKGYFFSLFKSSIEYLVSNFSLQQLDSNIQEYNKMLNNEISNLESHPESILEFH
jgi:hypothetical protein